MQLKYLAIGLEVKSLTRKTKGGCSTSQLVRTNYRKFNIRFSGVKVWNALEPDIKLLSMSTFKARLKSSLISKY